MQHAYARRRKPACSRSLPCSRWAPAAAGKASSTRHDQLATSGGSVGPAAGTAATGTVRPQRWIRCRGGSMSGNASGMRAGSPRRAARHGWSLARLAPAARSAVHGRDYRRREHRGTDAPGRPALAPGTMNDTTTRSRTGSGPGRARGSRARSGTRLEHSERARERAPERRDHERHCTYPGTGPILVRSDPAPPPRGASAIRLPREHQWRRRLRRPTSTIARPTWPRRSPRAAVFVLYLLTLAPSTAMWDTSEYITAAYTLGLPHPPGNPLFVLIGRVFAILPIAPHGRGAHQHPRRDLQRGVGRDVVPHHRARARRAGSSSAGSASSAARSPRSSAPPRSPSGTRASSTRRSTPSRCSASRSSRG